jgi:stage II sporulation protein AA (anti-sigma F factor antagonist)
MTESQFVDSGRAYGSLGIRTVRVKETVEFVLSGELDLSSVAVLKDELTNAITDPARVIVDLRGLTFIDSSGIQVLVAIKRLCVQRGIELSLRLGDSQVGRMLSLAGVAEFLGIS